MRKYAENKPTAEVLMNSMRSFGYSFEAAVADVIDNSISAVANTVQLYFPIDPTRLYVSICDNGYGMTQTELYDAMKYGSTMKKHMRAADDLGRFGLGLKSASLSQCRKLTVISKKDGAYSGYCWDLDIVEKEQDWLMIELTQEDIQKVYHFDFLSDKSSGTIVQWEDFDVLQKSSGNVYADLMDKQGKTSDYLSLIFHRYLNRGTGKTLAIRINEFDLKGLDPFLENNPKTTVKKRFSIPINDSNNVERLVYVQPFVLPFQKDLSAKDKKLSGGVENYRTKQGFYIYRNERLIVWGHWFGRAHDELTKYARIRVDIPNTLDDIWGIDIKKQTATIPLSIKQRLTRAVDDAMDISVKKQTYRGRVAKVDDKIDYIWIRKECRENQFEYCINRNSRIFDLLKDKVSEEALALFNTVLDEIEKNIPYQQIYIDKSRNVIEEEDNDERKAEIIDLAKVLVYSSLKMNPKEKVENIIDRLMTSEPFVKYPDIKNAILESLKDD